MTTLAARAFGTSRLDLVPLVVEHAEEMAAVLSDPALHTFTGGAPDTPRAPRSRCRRLTAGSPDPAVVAHIHPGHHASAAVATAAGLTRTDEWHDGEIQWRGSIGR